MAISMTGYGRGEAQGVGKQLTVELKSVNHRFLELVIRMPRQYSSLEERIKRLVQEKVSRGRIEIMFNFKESGDTKRYIKVDKEIALAYDRALEDLAHTLDTHYTKDVYRLISLPEVVSVEEREEDLEDLWAVCQVGLREALTSFVEMRSQEGNRLGQDLEQRLTKIAQNIEEIQIRQPKLLQEHQEKMRTRISELLIDVPLDENRLANEIAVFADKVSIAEELVRLASHIEQFRLSLHDKESVGRKLDFLTQELNREINTIGSKANDLEIGKIVVDVKSEIEKIREQVQNLE